MIEIPGYTLLRQLGRGGMGEVYLALQQSLGREVALKLLSPALSQDPVASERFVREARIAANLHHPHIVPIYDVGVHHGTAYIAMEYEAGGTVAALAHERADATTALRIARDIAEALDYAHRQGVVHRDVKPENILRRADGLCLLSDFGIARAVEAKTILTQEGSSVGTPQYMSPEQLSGKDTDGRSDLYSLGVVLYQLLTGELPYNGSDSYVIGMQHINAPIPRLPATLAHLQSLIDSLMAKDPSARPQTGAEVVSRVDVLQAAATPALTKALGFAPPASRRRFPWLIGATAAVLAVSAVAIWSPWRAQPSASAPTVAASESTTPATASIAVLTPATASIAVLPFVNMSSDKEQEYFSDGLAEELLDQLAKIPQLHVAGRTSAFAFKGKNEDLRIIGQKLNVAAVLEGSVRRSGDKIRITTQLINVADGYHLWSETYDRQLTDIFAVQDDIAGAVVTALKGKLLREQGLIVSHLSTKPVKRLTRHYTESVEAYDLYLKCRYHWDKSEIDEVKKAVDLCQQAVAKDPNYVPAYFGWADALAYLAWIGLPPREYWNAAKAPLGKALSLDDSFAQAHYLRGNLSLYFDYDPAASAPEFKRALELDPNSPEPHYGYAEYLAAVGRLDEAINELQHSVELDPLSLVWNEQLGGLYCGAHQYDRAIQQWQKALDIEPNFWFAHQDLGVVYVRQGKYKEALAEFEKADSLAGGSGYARGYLGYGYAVSGRREDAEKTIVELKALSSKTYVPAFAVAVIYTGLGEKDQAFEWLNKAYEQREGWLEWYFLLDPEFDSLRSDKRYDALLQRLNVPSSKS